MSTLPDDFDDFVTPPPASGEKLDFNTLKGSLLVFHVEEVLEHVQTVHTQAGEKTPATRATVYVVDGPQAGLVREDALIFPRRLQKQLREYVGRHVVGRLQKGVPFPGLPAPWELDQNTTPAEMATAQAFVREYHQQPPKAPKAPAASSFGGSEAPF